MHGFLAWAWIMMAEFTKETKQSAEFIEIQFWRVKFLILWELCGGNLYSSLKLNFSRRERRPLQTSPFSQHHQTPPTKLSSNLSPIHIQISATNQCFNREKLSKERNFPLTFFPPQSFAKVSLIKRFSAPNLCQMSKNERNFPFFVFVVGWMEMEILKEATKIFEYRRWKACLRGDRGRSRARKALRRGKNLLIRYVNKRLRMNIFREAIVVGKRNVFLCKTFPFHSIFIQQNENFIDCICTFLLSFFAPFTSERTFSDESKIKIKF